MKKQISPLNYIVVNGWMVSELGLKGNELLVYALIYGFTQDSKQWFYGSRQYIADFIGVKEVKNVGLILKRLVEKGHLKKNTEQLENNTLLVSYKAIIPPNYIDWLNM